VGAAAALSDAHGAVLHLDHDRILRFDPSRHRLVPAGRLPAPVFDAAAGTVAGVGYLAGGIGAQGTSVDSMVKLSENP